MNLIQISNEKIVDVDTVTVYLHRGYTDTGGNQIEQLFITQPDGEGIELRNNEAFNLWEYLIEKSNNQTFRMGAAQKRLDTVTEVIQSMKSGDTNAQH